MCTAASDIQWFKVSTRACNDDSFFFCVQEGVSYLMTFEGIGSLSAGVSDATTLRITSQQFYCVLLDSTAVPACFTAPVRNVWELQKRFGASPSWRRNVFWSRFSDPGTLWGPARADVEWLMNTEPGLLRRDQTAGRKLGSTFHLPTLQPWGTCYIVRALRWCPLSVQSKCEQCIMSLLGPLHQITFIFLFVYLKKLWGFHWTCFSLSFCFHVAFYFYFYFVFTIHATFCFWCGIFFFLRNDHTTCSAETVPWQS